MECSHRRNELEETLTNDLLLGLLPKKSVFRWSFHRLRFLSNFSSARTKLSQPIHDYLPDQHQTIHWKVPKPNGDSK